MTEKRFTVEDDDADIWENNHFLAVAYDHHNALKFAKRLNELYKKKEELKKEREELFIRERDTKNDCRVMKYDLDKQKESFDKCHKMLMGSYKENKELKNHIKVLQNHCKRLENQNIQTYTTIKEAYDNERTELGKSVLKQLMEAIQ